MKIEIIKNTQAFTVTVTGKKLVLCFSRGQLIPAKHVHISDNSVVIFTPEFDNDKTAWVEIPLLATKWGGVT